MYVQLAELARIHIRRRQDGFVEILSRAAHVVVLREDRALRIGGVVQECNGD
jgi:hypothetical protein